MDEGIKKGWDSPTSRPGTMLRAAPAYGSMPAQLSPPAPRSCPGVPTGGSGSS